MINSKKSSPSTLTNGTHPRMVTSNTRLGFFVRKLIGAVAMINNIVPSERPRYRLGLTVLIVWLFVIFVVKEITSTLYLLPKELVPIVESVNTEIIATETNTWIALFVWLALSYIIPAFMSRSESIIGGVFALEIGRAHV